MPVDLFTPADHWAMQQAMDQAALAAQIGEVPVGAVVVDAEGSIIGTGYNRTITDHDPTAHAEIVALRDAAARVGNYRLPGARVYVTLEPCTMCMGAMVHARVAQVVFGAADAKTGACGSVLNIAAIDQINHHTQVAGGLLAEACGALLSDFFRARRAAIREQKGKPPLVGVVPTLPNVSLPQKDVPPPQPDVSLQPDISSLQPGAFPPLSGDDSS